LLVASQPNIYDPEVPFFDNLELIFDEITGAYLHYLKFRKEKLKEVKSHIWRMLCFIDSFLKGFHVLVGEPHIMFSYSAKEAKQAKQDRYKIIYWVLKCLENAKNISISVHT